MRLHFDANKAKAVETGRPPAQSVYSPPPWPCGGGKSAGLPGPVLVQYPLMTAKVIGAINRQALSLLLKGCPFLFHPGSSKNAEDQAAGASLPRG